MGIPFILSLLSPEILLSATAFLVLLVDIFFIRKHPVPDRHELLGRFVLIGVAIVFIQLFFRFRAEMDAGSAITLGNGIFVASPLNSVFKLLVLGLTFFIVLMGIPTAYSSHVGEYYALLLFSTLGMMFLISSEDILMIFVALEMVSLTLYALAAFQKGALRSVEGGLKYFVFGGLSAGFLLFGLSYLYGATGHTSLKEIAAVLSADRAASLPMGLIHVGILFSLVGLGFKIAAVPFHLWAPDAYQGAPTPVTAVIATGSKVASFVALTKFLLVGLVGVAGATLWPWQWKGGWTVYVTVLAVLSMLIGNLAAIGQTNVKRLLAYSSVAHAGYILVAIVSVSAAGVPAEIAVPSIFFYVLIYSLTNVGVFGVVNAVGWRTGGDDFSNFTGLARRSPFLAFMMLIFLLSLAGIPPLAGFFGKFYLFAAAVQADPKDLGLLWLVIFAILMSAVSLYYYLKLAKQMYVIPAAQKDKLPQCFATNTALAVVCALVILFGIFPGRVIQFFGSSKIRPGAVQAQSLPLPDLSVSQVDAQRR
jgi:NADH-quinone oxidoreductase subunit N